MTQAEPHLRHHLHATLEMALCALLWSSGGLLLKSVDWHPLAVGGARALIASAFLLVTLRRWRLPLDRTVLGGALAYASTTLLFASATKLTTAANAILLQYTAPVYVALLGPWLVGEKSSWVDWLTVVVVLAGMALFFGDRLSPTGFLGNVLAITSGVTFALMTLLMRRQKAASPVDSLVLGNLIAGAVGLPFMLTSPPPGALGWAALVGLGVFQLGVSYFLYARAIRHLSALEAVLIPVLEPLLNPVWVMLVLGERPGSLALIGGAIVLVAVTTRAAYGIRRTHVPTAREPTAA